MYVIFFSTEKEGSIKINKTKKFIKILFQMYLETQNFINQQNR